MTKKSIIALCVILISCISNQTSAQKLRFGDAAPQIKTFDVFGEEVHISKNNHSKVLIGFMRYVGCPVCNFRTHELIENYDSIVASGYKIILVYESNSETLKKYLTETPVPFQVIADPKRKLYKKFGVQPSFWKTLKSAFNKKATKDKKKGNELFENNRPKRDGKLTGIPADFLITEDGRIERAYFGKNISDHLPINEIIK